MQGVPLNVLLPFEPWGHIDHKGTESQCLSSDHTGSYIHVQSIDQSPRDSVLSPLLSPLDMAAGEALLCWEKIPDDAGALVSREILSARPGAVPFVSHRTGTYGGLLMAIHKHMRYLVSM